MQTTTNPSPALPFHAGVAYGDYIKRLTAYVLAAMVAFLMSAYFIVGYLAGNIHFWTWTSDQWLNGIVGIGLTATMTLFQFFLYSQGDIASGKKATILAVFVAAGFSLLSEVGQGMERDSIRMEQKSLESPAYQAIVGSIAGVASSAYVPYSNDLQKAQRNLADCELKLQRGQVENCVHSQARLTAVNQLIEQANAAKESRALALATTAKTMERDENNYHPLVVLIKDSFNLAGIVASFTLSLIIIVFFEYAFHYLGSLYATARDNLRAHGYDTTRRTRKEPRILSPSGKSPRGEQLANVNQKTTFSTPAQPSAEGQTVRKNPVLGTEEEQLPMPTFSTPAQPSAEGLELERAYQVWTREVINGQMKPTIKPVVRWISERDLVTGIKAIEALAYEWLALAEKEGLIKNNPDGGIGKAKYILAGQGN